MEEEIGKTAGAIWDALNTRGELSLSELKKAVKRQRTHLRLGNWVAGARKPDCDHAREALFANPLETRAGKGDGRLVG
jgi:winged helix-turn-helix protein DUF2582